MFILSTRRCDAIWGSARQPARRRDLGQIRFSLWTSWPAVMFPPPQHPAEATVSYLQTFLDFPDDEGLGSQAMFKEREIQGAYQIKVTTAALALLFSTRHVELEKINVQGHLIKSSAGITTRSKAKTAPDQWTVMPLPVKILAILADSLVEMKEQALIDGDEDDEWEEAEGGDIERDEALLIAAGPTSNSRPTYEYLNAVAKAFNEDDDDGYNDDLHCSGDPLNEINVANYLIQFLKEFSSSSGALLPHILTSLTKAQQEAILMVLNQ